jgi:hypothetical protein
MFDLVSELRLRIPSTTSRVSGVDAELVVAARWLLEVVSGVGVVNMGVTLQVDSVTACDTSADVEGMVLKRDPFPCKSSATVTPPDDTSGVECGADDPAILVTPNDTSVVERDTGGTAVVVAPPKGTSGVE